MSTVSPGPHGDPGVAICVVSVAAFLVVLGATGCVVTMRRTTRRVLEAGTLGLAAASDGITR